MIELLLAALVVVAALAGGGLILLLRALVAAVEEHNVRLGTHTTVMREAAVAAPEAVAAERDRLAEDYQRLAQATAVGLDFTPDPEAGGYRQGAVDALSHVREHVRAAMGR